MSQRDNFVTAIFLIVATFTITLSAQNLERKVDSLQNDVSEIKKVKLDGFIQAQFMHTDLDGTSTYSGANFPTNSHNIFKVRRGRIKASYTYGISSYVFQLQATETGFQIVDAYVDVAEPLFNVATLRAGVFKVPMTSEILAASDLRYCMEEARIVQILLPGVCDMGAMLTFQGPKETIMSPLSLNVALITGNGIASETDNQKNIVARLAYSNTFSEKFTMKIAASTYQGKIYKGNLQAFKMDGIRFLEDAETTATKYAPRTYYAGEIELGCNSIIGNTVLNGQYWMGIQSGTPTSSASPVSPIPDGTNVRIRNFNGIITTLTHTIPQTNLTLAVKYDTYDPNTNISCNDIGQIAGNTYAADISYRTLGLGLIFEPTKHLRFSLWYDNVTNEKSNNLIGFEKDIRDNVITLRTQVRI